MELNSPARRRFSLGRITRGPVLNITRDNVPKSVGPSMLPPIRPARTPAPVVAPEERAARGAETVHVRDRVRVGDFVRVDGERCEVVTVIGTWQGSHARNRDGFAMSTHSNGWIVCIYSERRQRGVGHVRVTLEDLS